jgi:large subunit ribosomal protein L19
MNILAEITKSHLKKNVPALKIGDTVRIHQKIRDIDAKGKERERIQIFEGIVIARKHGNGIEGTFTVRKIAAGGIGVERVFPLHSPQIVKIERVKSATVRQSKLYYLRDVKSAAMRLRKETRTPEVWEEKGAEAEIEALKEETAAAAEAAAEEKAEEAEPTEAVSDSAAEAQAEQPTETPAETEEKTESAE